MTLPLYGGGGQVVADSNGCGADSDDAAIAAAINHEIAGQLPPCYVTKLLRNYRAHEKLLALPSRLFYDDELQAAANEDSTHRMLPWKALRSSSRSCTTTASGMAATDDPPPILCCGVDGQEDREIDSPSFYNVIEATKVVELIEQLLSADEIEASTTDIGVITPFRKQVLTLRALLRSRGLGAINVGSIDDFQGQEMAVIFISTVLSTPRDVDVDGDVEHANRHSQLHGFLGDPKVS